MQMELDRIDAGTAFWRRFGFLTMNGSRLDTNTLLAIPTPRRHHALILSLLTLDQNNNHVRFLASCFSCPAECAWLSLTIALEQFQGLE